jgi:photosystem I subunit 10
MLTIAASYAYWLQFFGKYSPETLIAGILRREPLDILTLLAVVPRTLTWNPTVGLVMLICNIAAIAFARYTVQNPNEGPSGPALPLLGNLSLGTVIGAACFGHILGTGAILGLSNLGVL